MKKILFLVPTLLLLTGCGHNILTVQEGTYLNLGFNSNTNDLGIQYGDGSNITIINRQNTKLEIEMTDALDSEGKAIRKVSKIIYHIRKSKEWIQSMNVKIFYDAFEKSTKVQLTEELFVGKFYIPRGFVSDGGSIPRFFWRIFNPLDGRYLKYYIQHDFIYATGIRERKDADILLRKGLEKSQMNFLGRWAVYFSVRLFGSKHYNKFEKI